MVSVNRKFTDFGDRSSNLIILSYYSAARFLLDNSLAASLNDSLAKV